MIYKIAKWNKRISAPCSVEIEGEAVTATLFVHAYNNGGINRWAVSDTDTGAYVADGGTKGDAIDAALELANTTMYARSKRRFISQYGLVANMPPAPTE